MWQSQPLLHNIMAHSKESNAEWFYPGIHLSICPLSPGDKVGRTGREGIVVDITNRSKQKLPRILACFPLCICLFRSFFLFVFCIFPRLKASFQKPVSVRDHVMTWIFRSLSRNSRIINMSLFAQSLGTESPSFSRNLGNQKRVSW